MIFLKKKNKHLTINVRLEIQDCLNKGISFKDIARQNKNIRIEKVNENYDKYIFTTAKN